MIWFLALIMTAAVLYVVLKPLVAGAGEAASRADYDITVYRDQLKEVDRDLERGLLSPTEAEAASTEIKRRMLAAVDEADQEAQGSTGRRTVLASVLAVAVPVAAFGLYTVHGSPDKPDLPLAARNLSPAETETAAADPHAQGGPDMRALVGRLAERLMANPNDPDGWQMLARSYLAMNEPQKAANALRMALTFFNDPVLLADYGEALFLAAGSRVTDEAAQVLRAAMAADPYQPKPYYYLGLGLAQEGKMTEAMQLWVDLLEVSPDNAPWLQEVFELVSRAAADAGIDPNDVTPSARAKELAANKPAPAPAAAAPAGPAAPGVAAPDPDARQAVMEMSPEERMAFMRDRIAAFAERVRENPDDIQGWRQLARFYRVLGETEKAAEADAKIRELEER